MLRAVTVEKLDLFFHVSKLVFVDFFFFLNEVKLHQNSRNIPLFPTELSQWETIWVAILH